MATATAREKPPSSARTVPAPTYAAQPVVFPPGVVCLLDVLARIEQRRQLRLRQSQVGAMREAS